MTSGPPVAPRDPKRLEHHGDVRVDDYFWLREREDPRVRAYLEAENAYTEAQLAHTTDLQEQLYKEFLSRIQETDTSAMVPKRPYLYYSRTVEGLQYPIYCRAQAPNGGEEILLDLNERAEGYDYHGLGVFDVSEDHRWLAFAEDVTGAESYTLRFKDLVTGDLLEDATEGVYYTSAWCNDHRTLYYTVHDEAKRPYRLYRHTLGTDPSMDELVYEERDERFYLTVGKTRSQRLVLVLLESAVTTEYRYLDADDPGAGPLTVEPRHQEHEYYVEHHEDVFWIRTNEGAKNFRLVEAPVAAPGRENWTEIVPHRPKVKLEGAEAFAGHRVLWEREDGLMHAHITDLASGRGHRIEMPEPVYGLWQGPNAEWDTTALRIVYTSLTTPASHFDYGMTERAWTLVKEQPVPGYDKDVYVAERTFATAPDGERVPISLVRRKGVDRDGSDPMYLYGYGSYGASMDPYFSPSRVSLLDRGFVYAIAHVRGGGELGEPWHDAGKLLQKTNTFTDFIASAEHLIAEGWTKPGEIAIEGGSAGGLLVGAVTNMRPDLFRAVVADVPFVDCLNTMLDPSLPLTATEWEEWGNPIESRDAYHYMKGYAPYENVTAQDYPHMLVLAGFNDPRVSYWEPAKWVARLRATKTDRNLLVLKTNMEVGHSGPSGRYDLLREIALKYAFVVDRVVATRPRT